MFKNYILPWNKRNMTSKKINILANKYLNNSLEQDDRSIIWRMNIAKVL
jgi:hypothetical protein